MNIAATGVHYHDQLFTPGTRVLLELSGTFGGTTATFGLKDPSGAFAAARLPGTLTAATATATAHHELTVGSTGQIGVSLAGGSGIAAILTATPVKSPVRRS